MSGETFDIGRTLLWAYVAIFGGYCLIVLAGSIRRPRAPALAATELTMGIVVPAYNEQRHLAHIQRTIEAAQQLGVPMIAVDDGSNDGSADLLEELCRAGGARLLRQQPNRGKAAALNAGIAALATDLVLTIDADTTFDPARLGEALAPFGNPAVGAVALTVDGAGGSRVARAQIVEYRYLLNFERESLARFGVVFTVPGSASLWRTRALAEIGGFTSRTCAEDTDATIALSLAGWKIEVAADVRAVTECPVTLAALIRQRSRWIWGTIQAAGYAVAHLATRPVRSVGPAIVFVAVTALNLFGFVLSLGILGRVMASGLEWSEVAAALVLFLTGLLRLGLAHWKENRSGGSILKVMLRLIGVQIANTLAFWHGLLTGRAIRMSW